MLHVAVENRQPFVVEELKNRYEQKNKKLVFDNLTLGVDEEECTLLHMAATLSDKGWMISVAASQMMCHIKWFQVHDYDIRMSSSPTSPYAPSSILGEFPLSRTTPVDHEPLHKRI